MAGQQAIGNTATSGAGDRVDVVVSGAVIHDVGEDRSSLGQTNYRLENATRHIDQALTIIE